MEMNNQKEIDEIYSRKLKELQRKIKHDERFQSAYSLIDRILENPKDPKRIEAFRDSGYEFTIEMPDPQYFEGESEYKGIIDYNDMRITLKYTVFVASV